MKFTIAAVVSALLGLSTYTSAAAEQLRVGFAAEPYPPYASVDSAGNWEGWEVDFSKAICEEAKFDCVIVPLAFDGLIAGLNVGKIDMIIASLSITKERQKSIDFSDPYKKVGSAILSGKGLDFEPTPEGLANKIVGVQTSSIQEAYANKYFRPAGTAIKSYQTGDDSYNDLAAGRVDAVLSDALAVDNFLKTEQGSDCCELKGNIKDDPEIFGYGTGVGVRKADDALKAKVNTAIKAIRANGVYENFNKKYFAIDIFGD